MANLILEVHSRSHSDEFAAKIARSASVEPKMKIERAQYPKGGILREGSSVLSQLDRLLDPQNNTGSLVTLARAAALSGKRLVIEIRDQHPVKIIDTRKKGSLPLLGQVLRIK